MQISGKEWKRRTLERQIKSSYTIVTSSWAASKELCALQRWHCEPGGLCWEAVSMSLTSPDHWWSNLGRSSTTGSPPASCSWSEWSEFHKDWPHSAGWIWMGRVFELYELCMKHGETTNETTWLYLSLLGS